MKGSVVLLVALAATTAWGEEMQHQPRTLGNTAVMHVYYYAPQSLEVTYVMDYLFKDESACKEAIPRALMIASPYASEGDLVSASCVGMTPPQAVRNPQKTVPPGATDL